MGHGSGPAIAVCAVSPPKAPHTCIMLQHRTTQTRPSRQRRLLAGVSCMCSLDPDAMHRILTLPSTDLLRRPTASWRGRPPRRAVGVLRRCREWRRRRRAAARTDEARDAATGGPTAWRGAACRGSWSGCRQVHEHDGLQRWRRRLRLLSSRGARCHMALPERIHIVCPADEPLQGVTGLNVLPTDK